MLTLVLFWRRLAVPNLLEFTSIIAKSLNDRKDVRKVYTDFSEALVPFTILFPILRHSFDWSLLESLWYAQRTLALSVSKCYMLCCSLRAFPRTSINYLEIQPLTLNESHKNLTTFSAELLEYLASFSILPTSSYILIFR